MINHFIKNIEIKDFKCFNNFKAEGFARVNLIGGKNNVGKTAFMEACYINSSAINLKLFIFTLHSIKLMRENLNLLRSNLRNDTKKFIEQSNNIFVKTNINTISYKIKEEQGIKKYWFEYANNPIIKVNINEFSFEIEHPKNIIFIDSFGLSNYEIKYNFSSVQKKDEEEYINKTLKEFDSNITTFKIINNVPQCKVNGEYLEITEFGDGVRHLISLLTSFYHSENGYLFIDEIDNGIHYTMLDNIWNIILDLSKKFNVQVFATTHSKECIESYARVAKKLEEKDITYTILSKLKDGSIDAGVYDSKMLINTLNQDHEVRGW